MTDLNDNRLVAAFGDLASAGRKTVLPFITGGYPDCETTVGLLKDFEARGARICEIGVPFSDPVADGPTIQASYTKALAGGVTLEKILRAVADYRAAGGAMALVAMVSYSIVYRRGPESFCDRAQAAGFDGLIVPDLSLEEAGGFEAIAAGRGLANVMLTAPNTPRDRRIEIAAHSRGFLYFMSVAGITGERTKLPPETIEAVGELRQHVDVPICVGFGISSPEMVANVCRTADGAIVGSAIVHRITDRLARPREEIIASAGSFLQELLAPLQG